MTISVMADNQSVPVKFLTFSDGGEYLRIDLPKNRITRVSVTIRDEPAGRYLWLLSLVHEIVTRHGAEYNQHIRIVVYLPYLPHARADRVFEPGMANPVSNFVREATRYCNELVTADVHSTNTLLPWIESGFLTVTPQKQCFRETINSNRHTVDINRHDLVLVAPDKGAVEKTREIVGNWAIDRWLVLHKKRDPLTGHISEQVIDQQHGEFDISGQDYLIIDDICDGGGTFIMAADLLRARGARSVSLYVTHGIFSKGLDAFRGKLDKIICWHTVGGYVSQQDLQAYNLGDTRG